MSFLLPRLLMAEKLKRVFAKEKHKPIEVVLTNGIVFRDTLALTNMSLSNLAKNYTKTQKLVGELDYNLPRNSHTQLSTEEIHYCVNDVQILGEYADQLHAEYTMNKQKIPLTSTGIVRAYIKREIKNGRYYTGHIANLYPPPIRQVGQFIARIPWIAASGFVPLESL